ncbi:hypothetical protein D6774_04285 [Candidatus Woesearchaeota archaeon]|nr:MAG: hypothetical protein D6774_04285 [Candidatus Woesearchaeota archaeon]
MTRTIPVVIASPYLMEDMSERYDEHYVQIQKEKFGYDPNNFAGVRELNGPDLTIELIDARNSDIFLNAKAPLYISGSTSAVERVVHELRGSRRVIARFSIFYGKASGYSGDYPEETGYALDIPKSVEAVKRMLTHTPTMLALQERNLDDLLKGLNDLNKHLQQPVLTTPYLQEVFS